MGTVKSQQTRSPLVITVQDQVLTHYPYLLGFAAFDDFGRDSYRKSETAKHCTTGGVATRSAKKLVLFLAQHSSPPIDKGKT